MNDKLIFKSHGRKIFEKKITRKGGLEEAIEDLRRKFN
jgi:hypothetical protein